MPRKNDPSTGPSAANYLNPIIRYGSYRRDTAFTTQTCLRHDGTIPEGFEAQLDQVWQNTIAALASMQLQAKHIIKLTVYSTDSEGRLHVDALHRKYLDDHIPVSTYLLVAGLAEPEWRVVMDVTAIHYSVVSAGTEWNHF